MGDGSTERKLAAIMLGDIVIDGDGVNVAARRVVIADLRLTLAKSARSESVGATGHPT